MAWVSPTGHADPGEEWGYEENAYDEDEGSWANSDDAYLEWLELTLTTPISCDKIRIMAASLDIPDIRKDPNLKIEVYYSDAWHEIFVGEITKEIWVEKAIGSTQTVSKAQIKWFAALQDYGLVYEFDFNEVEAPPPTYIPKVIMITGILGMVALKVLSFLRIMR